MTRRSLQHDHAGAVSVLFAGAAVPLVGLLGLAIDFSLVSQARTQMELAADTAAISSVRVASTEFTNGTSSWNTDGQANGTQWFGAQLGSLRSGSLGSKTNPTGLAVTVTRNGTQFTSAVNYTASVPTYFSALFGFSKFLVSGTSTASALINAYVNISMMLDNSSSMLIGASTADINTLQNITACSPMAAGSGQSTSAWSASPLPSTCPKSYTSSSSTVPVAGQAPNTAACGFACHWSNNNQVTTKGAPDYTKYDYYALARNPSLGPITGYSAPTLRFDVVQSATANVISTMKSSAVMTNQFGLGVFMFNSSFTQVYPSSGEASTDLDSGATAVQNITTPVVTNNGDTNFPSAMNTLSTTLTRAGDGSSSSSPRKYVFLVTDGIQDYPNRVIGQSEGPFSNTAAVNACSAIRALGINIYVLYTPYTPLPNNPYYVSNISQFVTSSNGNDNAIVAALKTCAGNSANFFEADSAAQITSAMQAMLKAAMQSPARISS